MRPAGPSPNLTWFELACHDDARTPYPRAWRADRAVTLAMEFEALWVLAGNRPLIVTTRGRRSG